MCAISQSGETKDVHRAVLTADKTGRPYIRASPFENQSANLFRLRIWIGIPAISVVNAVGSLIARTTKLGVYLNAGRESSVASTKAFTTQVHRSRTVARTLEISGRSRRSACTSLDSQYPHCLCRV